MFVVRQEFKVHALACCLVRDLEASGGQSIPPSGVTFFQICAAWGKKGLMWHYDSRWSFSLLSLSHPNSPKHFTVCSGFKTEDTFKANFWLLIFPKCNMNIRLIRQPRLLERMFAGRASLLPNTFLRKRWVVVMIRGNIQSKCYMGGLKISCEEMVTVDDECTRSRNLISDSRVRICSSF